MKNLLVVSVAVISILSSSCKKDKTTVSGPVYRGVVVAARCGSVVVQTIGPEHLGQETWINGNEESKPVCHNVFVVENSCELANVKGSGPFNFVLGTTENNNCFQCLAALVSAPDAKYSIRIVK